MCDRERKGVLGDRSEVLKLKGSLPQGPPAHWRNTEDLRLIRVGMKQLREVRRSCTGHQRQCGNRWELFCFESGCWSVASGDWRAKEWQGQTLELCIWGKLSSWAFFEFYQEKPEGSQQELYYNNKRGNESFGFKRKVLLDWTNPPHLQVSQLNFITCSFSTSWVSKVIPQNYELRWKKGSMICSLYNSPDRSQSSQLCSGQCGGEQLTGSWAAEERLWHVDQSGPRGGCTEWAGKRWETWQGRGPPLC